MTVEHELVWSRHANRSAAASHYAREFKIHEITAQVLINRGFNGLESMRAMMHPAMDQMHDPFLMKNMDAAVRRIRRAMVRRERIHIHGDYDVDGITATAVIMLGLSHVGADVHYHIINRADSSVGLSIASLERDHVPHSPKLIITTDCGTSSNAAIERAAELGIDVIVVDHHHPGTFIPKCAALLNPQQPRCNFPFPQLAAVGVAFNLVCALDSFLQRDDASWPQIPILDYTDLVALGTVSDLVPLTDENRLFVHHGLKHIRCARRPGICALMRAARLIEEPERGGYVEPITARTIGFKLAPLLNAAGRMNDANKCVELLTTTSYRVADGIAQNLVASNTLRQQSEREVLEQATDQASAFCNEGRQILVLAERDWHPGVLGIVASRLVERFNRPSVVAAIDGSGMAKGSVRSPDGIDMLDALKSCRDILETYGGHRVAAGVAFPDAHLPELRHRLETAVRSQVPDGAVPRRSIQIDALVDLALFDQRVAEELDQLAPFGAGNPEPLFEVRGVQAIGARAVNGRNLRFRVRKGDAVISAFAYGLGGRVEQLRRPVDIVFHPRVVRNEKTSELELVVKDFAPAR